MTNIFTRHSVGRFGTDDDECSRLSETGRRDDGPVQIPLQKRGCGLHLLPELYAAHLSGICLPIHSGAVGSRTIGYQELAERCLRMAGHQKLWKRASSLSKGKTLPLALEPAHRHRLSEWPEAGTASICPQKLAAVYLLSSRIGSGGECFPIYLTEGSTSPPFPCGGSTRGTIRCTEQPRASTAGSCSLPRRIGGRGTG